MLESLIKEKEVKYKLYNKYVLLLRILKRQPSLDEERIKKVTLELADITIDLDTNLQHIYDLEVAEAEKMPSISARQEKERRKRLLELSKRRQKEIEELFGNNDDDGKSGYSEVLYHTEKMDKINSYLKIKKEQERIEAENRKLRLVEDDLSNVIKKYNVEIVDLENELRESIEQVFEVLNLNGVDFDNVDYKINRLERDMIVVQGLLSFSRDSLDITSDEKKEIKKLDNNNTISNLYFELREKQLFFYIRQIINTKNTSFAESYKNLIIISRYLKERKELKERLNKNKDDHIEFLYTLISEQRVKYEKQLAVRTNLDDVKETIERNLLEIRQYDGIINDSKDMQSLLSGIVEKEEESLEGEYTYNLPTNESVMDREESINTEVEEPIYEIPTVEIPVMPEEELEPVTPINIEPEEEILPEEPIKETNPIINEHLDKEEALSKQTVTLVDDLPHTLELLVNNIKNREKYRGSLLKIMNFVESQMNS